MRGHAVSVDSFLFFSFGKENILGAGRHFRLVLHVFFVCLFVLSVKKVVCEFEGGGTVRARVWLRTEHDVVWRERERERERERD